MSCEEPLAPGLVIQYCGLNYVVERELTKEQFMRVHLENMRSADAVSGVADLDGSRVALESAEDALEPPAYHKYFYVMKAHSRI